MDDGAPPPLRPGGDRERRARVLASASLLAALTAFGAIGLNAMFGRVVAPRVVFASSLALWAFGLGAGVFALKLRRRTGARGVLAPATLGVGLSGLMLALLALDAFARWQLSSVPD